MYIISVNENGELLQVSAFNTSWLLGEAKFPRKHCQLATWVSPKMRTVNQLHVCVDNIFMFFFRNFRSLQDVKVKRGADAALDHHYD